ncbi:uncharacterized protein LOC144097203 [Amblyomma americanum]
MRHQEQVGDRSVEAIHIEQQQQQEAQAETVFFSHGSLYAVGAMLTLAVLFCAGVLAYTVRRNDMLKTEYHRLMAAIADRGSKSSRIPTESEPPETLETMGPAPRVDDATQDAVLLLLTHRPISNIDHPGRTRRSTTSTPFPDGEALYNDYLEGRWRQTVSGTRSATRRTDTTGNPSAAGTSSSDAVTSMSSSTPKSSATPITTLKLVPNTTQQTTLVLESSTSVFVSTGSVARTSTVTHSSKVNASDSNGNSTHLGGTNDADVNNDVGAEEDA